MVTVLLKMAFIIWIYHLFIKASIKPNENCYIKIHHAYFNDFNPNLGGLLRGLFWGGAGRITPLA